jgi:hypothetical protein
MREPLTECHDSMMTVHATVETARSKQAGVSESVSYACRVADSSAMRQPGDRSPRGGQ